MVVVESGRVVGIRAVAITLLPPSVRPINNPRDSPAMDTQLKRSDRDIEPADLSSCILSSLTNVGTL